MNVPEIFIIDEGNDAIDTFTKFTEQFPTKLLKSGYYKYTTRLDNTNSNKYAIRLGHYPDFTNSREFNLLPVKNQEDINLNKPLTGILRFNHLENRFEISREEKYNSDGYFHPISGDFSGFRGKIFFKNLNIRDNNFPENFIINKGDSKLNSGNIFKELVTENQILENKIYEQKNLCSNPVFMYTGNDLFDLVQHTLTFSPNDSESYEIFVEKNYTWPLYDFSDHLDITNNLRTNGSYKYFFQDSFTFYGIKYSNMYINKLGFISFTEEINDLEEVSYEYMLKKKRINYFSGAQDFTYLSKSYIGLGKSNEIIITFLNIFPDTKINPINIQIILWEGNSLNKTNLFDNSYNRFNYYADNYEKNGTIKINYNLSLNENYLDNFNKILIGLTNQINYSSDTFEPLYFSNLIEKKIDLLNSNGIPNLKTKLLIKDQNLVGLNKLEVLNYKFNKTNLVSDEIFTTISDNLSSETSDLESKWNTYYRRNINNTDFFIKIGEIKISELNLSNDSKFFVAISSNYDKKFSLIPGLGNINNYGSFNLENLNEYYSDATLDILFKKLDDNEEIVELNLKEMDLILNNKMVPFEFYQMNDFLKPLSDENRKLEFVDLFPLSNEEYKYNSNFDSVLYKIQLNKSFHFKTVIYNQIEDLSKYEGLNLKNRYFTGYTTKKEKIKDPKYFLKVIYNSKASKNSINNSISKSILISEIGLFGPYHLKKNNISYYKIKLESNKKYIVSLVDLIESRTVNYGTTIEVFEGNQVNFIGGGAKYNGKFPEVTIDSSNLPLINDNILIYLKISSKINIFYYGILFQEEN